VAGKGLTDLAYLAKFREVQQAAYAAADEPLFAPLGELLEASQSPEPSERN
jgi:hypothetical protein